VVSAATGECPPLIGWLGINRGLGKGGKSHTKGLLMNDFARPHTCTSREQLLHLLYEAAELEHCLMCTYLYAAFSLKADAADGLTESQLGATRRWRSAIIQVAIEEMTHLAAVWNITAALGAAPRVGRQNLPLDPGYLPASVVVRLAPFDRSTLQHFIYLERPAGSTEPDGAGFIVERHFIRGSTEPRVTPMAMDYATVGEFYEAIGYGLQVLVAKHGEAATFCGDPSLQMTSAESGLPGLKRVVCLKTALAALETIVEQGEGAPEARDSSHFQRFCAIREELQLELERDAHFAPALPVATNPVLRIPPRAQGRVLIEEPDAAAVVDVANSCYGLMLRLMAHAYVIPADKAEKAEVIGLAVGLMRACTILSEHAARLPITDGATINAGVTFITLRDSAPFPSGASAFLMFRERLEELAAAAGRLAANGERPTQAAQVLDALSKRARSSLVLAAPEGTGEKASNSVGNGEPPSKAAAGEAGGPVVSTSPIDEVRGERVSILYEGRRCIHARHCVTGAPSVFLANVEGPWIHPDTMDPERLVDIAHACPSGAIRYARHDGRPQEEPPPVNLMAIREAGPYAFRGDLLIDGVPCGYRATLCRCGASQNKPYCDGSHRGIGFSASGEPATTEMTAALGNRAGRLSISPQLNGPLEITGSVEIVSGTGRVVARVQRARLCRCGASGAKPFCDGSHMRVGFRS